MKNSNLRIDTIIPLLSPEMVHHKLPAEDSVVEVVCAHRKQVTEILHGKNPRFLVIVGPCSIHEKQVAMDYAEKLKGLSDKLGDRLCILMRVYFEKPRTTIGWKGLINDPFLDDSLAINEGLMLAREILLGINRLGLGTATEFVDTITPQYIADLVSWAAIGARTTESQPHRMLASGLSMPVGFKNNTSGDIAVAVNAVTAANHSHRFLSVTEQGIGAIVITQGNDACHVILRGGRHGPNYESAFVSEAVSLLSQSHLPAKVMIDCSHDNADKDYRKQANVLDNICEQLSHDKQSIFGVMIESNLVAGKQALSHKSALTYGQSITDGCIGWQETEALLHQLADAWSL